MALDAGDQALLAIVLREANGNVQNVRYGLDEAMRQRGRGDPRNYAFVRRMLERAAVKKIHEDHRPKPLVLT